MKGIEIYKTKDAEIEVKVIFENESIWLDAHLMAALFEVNRPAVVKHIQNIYRSKELHESTTCSILEQVAADGKNRKMKFYNLDMIISVGYRINSQKATQFRQWATQRLKDYLVQGYAINEKRLAEKQQQVEHLKTGIRILSRAIGQQASEQDSETLQAFANGLQLLDDYDHEQLDVKGNTVQDTEYPTMAAYLKVIQSMKSNFESDVFAKPKDDGFKSSIHQIQQSFDSKDLYATIEEKAAMLLYLIVKNHSFVDGNKRIAAACFLHFLDKNKLLFFSTGQPLIGNKTLAALTLFVATSKPDEMETVKQFVISILNRRE